jgi:hypothetical protein
MEALCRKRGLGFARLTEEERGRLIDELLHQTPDSERLRMLRLRKVPILLSLASALILASTPLFADEVYLKGAGALSGRIVQQTDTLILIDIGSGEVGVPPDRVERIVKGRSPLDEYDERAARLGPQDVNGWRNLGRWAGGKGLSAQSRQAYENVLKAAPHDPEARQALGYVLVDGRWLTEEESYRARGYVKYEGEWMTPAEAQLAQSSAEADRARRDAEQQAQAAEERAQQAENATSDPVYWGGWGYGVTYWPSSPVVRDRPRTRPSELPARGGRR